MILGAVDATEAVIAAIVSACVAIAGVVMQRRTARESNAKDIRGHELDVLITEARLQRSDLKADVDQGRSDLREAVGRIERLEDALEQRDQRITELEREFTKRGLTIEELERRLGQPDPRISKMVESLNEKDARIVLLEQAVTIRDERIAHLEEHLARMQSELDRMSAGDDGPHIPNS